MRRKEAKGNARKLSDMQGRHARKVKFKSRELSGIKGKGNDRTKRARWPAVSRQRVNPASPCNVEALPSERRLLPPTPCTVCLPSAFCVSSPPARPLELESAQNTANMKRPGCIASVANAFGSPCASRIASPAIGILPQAIPDGTRAREARAAWGRRAGMRVRVRARVGGGGLGGRVGVGGGWVWMGVSVHLRVRHPMHSSIPCIIASHGPTHTRPLPSIHPPIPPVLPPFLPPFLPPSLLSAIHRVGAQGPKII